ncbi:MAG: hypothetical protein SLAVMIC_01031 [uncultured marine phage]|uniref:Uncharacterized protein n=1 Tax=uncultured marine phage TaxID=707152 RepID=A0A8D9FRL0_9VIRU|nr:MAG: hypothetical protein SLAVMIC_01031 [uncultured marine phage]
MKNKQIFVENLIDATKDGTVIWLIDKNYRHVTGTIKCNAKIDETLLRCDVHYNKDLSWDDQNGRTQIHIYDRVNINGNSLWIRESDYPSVREFDKYLYDKLVHPFLLIDKKDEDNNNFLGKLANKIGKSYFRERRLKRILKEKK